MDPITIAAAAVAAAAKAGFSSESLSRLLSILANRLTGSEAPSAVEEESTSATRSTARGMSAAQRARAQFEFKQSELREDILNLQTKIWLNVSNERLVARLTEVLFDQQLQLQDARDERDLVSIRARVGQAEGAYLQYAKAASERAIARRLAVLVSLVALLILAGILRFRTIIGLDEQSTVAVLKVPVSVILWSTIGSFTAILYRFTHFGDVEVQDPIRWLFARPLTGIVMGMVAYLVLAVGLVGLSRQDLLTGTASTAVIALIAFLAGFSDRFADGLLKSSIGQLGGDRKAALMGLEAQTQPAAQSLAGFWTDVLDKVSEKAPGRTSGSAGAARESESGPKVEQATPRTAQASSAPTGASISVKPPSKPQRHNGRANHSSSVSDTSREPAVEETDQERADG